MITNSLNMARYYRRQALKPGAPAPRGAKTILRHKLFLNRWQAAKILGPCGVLP